MSDSIPLKRCSYCKQLKPATAEYFWRRPERTIGLQPRCIACQRSIRALKHPPKPKEQLPEGYKRCTRCLAVFPATSEYFHRGGKHGLGWYCKACSCARSASYRPPRKYPLSPSGFRICAMCHETKPATLEYFRKSVRRSGLDARCKQCRSETRKQYFREHPEQRTKNVVRWRRYQKIPGSITSQQIQDKLRKQRYRCYYCNAKFEKRNGGYVYHLEHTIPISRTEHSPRHDVNYVVLACHVCNESKRDKLPHEWPRGGRLM